MYAHKAIQAYDKATDAMDLAETVYNAGQEILTADPCDDYSDLKSLGQRAGMNLAGRALSGATRAGRGPRLGVVADADPPGKVPNRWGSRGSPAHRGRIGEAEQRLQAKGWKTVAGGSRPEQKYGNRFPDLVMEKDGKQIAVQVGRTTQGGLPVSRERRAASDLRGSGQFSHVFVLGYD